MKIKKHNMYGIVPDIARDKLLSGKSQNKQPVPIIYIADEILFGLHQEKLIRENGREPQITTIEETNKVGVLMACSCAVRGANKLIPSQQRGCIAALFHAKKGGRLRHRLACPVDIKGARYAVTKIFPDKILKNILWRRMVGWLFEVNEKYVTHACNIARNDQALFEMARTGQTELPRTSKKEPKLTTQIRPSSPLDTRTDPVPPTGHIVIPYQPQNTHYEGLPDSICHLIDLVNSHREGADQARTELSFIRDRNLKIQKKLSAQNRLLGSCINSHTPTN